MVVSSNQRPNSNNSYNQPYNRGRGLTIAIEKVKEEDHLHNQSSFPINAISFLEINLLVQDLRGLHVKAMENLVT